MRISDWSSDVCFSDLLLIACVRYAEACSRPILSERHLPDVRFASLSQSLSRRRVLNAAARFFRFVGTDAIAPQPVRSARTRAIWRVAIPPRHVGRSEEPTSELPSLMRISYAVFCL